MELKLEVKKFNNEDVIATSVCNYITNSGFEHVYYGKDNEVGYEYTIAFENGLNGTRYQDSESDGYSLDELKDNFLSGVQPGAYGWYHLVIDGQESYYVKCTAEDHPGYDATYHNIQ